ncbi:hypothetical protein NDU88_003882 [Pleurodeles waltl]|uniref:Uncharacterized protein n=1 Tax=Pleurodeles waltl TaxID=8319 RepID=A0AAV7KWU8_PLEWA|nr:hypothetical protein NDU88_003882 [Pleurodeles waltl]
MRGVHPWRAEEDARNQAEEDNVGDQKEKTDARGKEKAESETGETGERQGEPHAERSYPGQLTPEGSPEEGKRNPETQRHRHVPGGAWLQRLWSCFHNRINALLGKEEGERVHLNPLSPDPLTILTRFQELRTKLQLTLPYLLSFHGFPGDGVSPRELRRDPEDLKERRRREGYIEKEETKKTDREDL